MENCKNPIPAGLQMIHLDYFTGRAWLLVFANDKTDATYGMQQFVWELIVDLAPQAGHVHVDDIIERRVAPRFFPDVARQHFPRDYVATMANEILE
jgi:hypothetical protein